jgi:hypothetical protein
MFEWHLGKRGCSEQVRVERKGHMLTSVNSSLWLSSQEERSF